MSFAATDMVEELAFTCPLCGCKEWGTFIPGGQPLSSPTPGSPSALYHSAKTPGERDRIFAEHAMGMCHGTRGLRACGFQWARKDDMAYFRPTGHMRPRRVQGMAP
jgi:hypothetical protein